MVAASSAACLVAAGIALVSLALGAGRRAHLLRGLGLAWTRLAWCRPFGIVLSGLLGLLAGAMWTAVSGPPVPRVHDEFSYLLAADTFAHGRLANPPVREDLRLFVDTVHVIQTPTYMSKYPPGQGLSLALGRVLFGLDIAGAWLFVALACAAVTWALYQLLPPRWALVGGLLTSLHPMVWQWTRTYWGGGVALLGGALFVGGFFAALRKRRRWGGVIAGLGAGVLAASRPYEGLLLVLAVGFWPVLATVRGKTPWRRMLALAGAVILGAAPILGWLGFYNSRVTGSPWVFPYQTWNEQYSQSSLWLFTAPYPLKPIHTPAMRDFHRWEREYWADRQGWKGFVYATQGKLETAAVAFVATFPPVWPALLLMLPAAFRSRVARRGLLTLALFSVGVLIETALNPHYAAPAFVLGSLTLTAACAGVIAKSRWRRPIGVGLAAGALLLAPAVPLSYLAFSVPQHEATRTFWKWGHQRAEIERQLMNRPGRHVVFVKYSAAHSMYNEWVYNGADLESTKVLWVRALGPKVNARLVTRLPGRQPWVVQADEVEPHLKPFPTRFLPKGWQPRPSRASGADPR
jgi:hypothetical protein